MREMAATGVVAAALAMSLTEADVPLPVQFEMRRALSTIIDFDRDVGSGDRFYVRYRQTFTGEGTPLGTGRLLWAELRTTAKGTIGLHRFRGQDGREGLWLGNGELAGAPPMRMPLDIVHISSGFGLRPDPLDKPGSATGPLAHLVTPAPEPPAPPEKESLRSSRLPIPDGLSALARDVIESRQPKFHRARPVQAAEASPEQSKVEPPTAPPPKRPLFMHEGIDLVATAGTEIYAAGNGLVAGAGPNGRYGIWIQINHADRVTTTYGHLSALAPGISVGMSVSRGELIGFVGNTGRSTGAHLHFEVVSNGRAINPLTFPAFRRHQLAGADLERFRQQVGRSLEERDREVPVEASTVCRVGSKN
jgi:murein DD-endopeptidase MepM/ murein hydrolase activator NlpD